MKTNATNGLRRLAVRKITADDRGCSRVRVAVLGGVGTASRHCCLFGRDGSPNCLFGGLGEPALPQEIQPIIQSLVAPRFVPNRQPLSANRLYQFCLPGQATARGGEFRVHVRKGRTVTGGAGRKGQAPGGGSRRGASSRARLFQRLRRLSRSMTSGWAPRCSASARTRCRPGWACSRAGSTWLRRSATKEAAREGVGCQRSRREPASLTERIISWSRRNLSPWLTDPLLMPRRP